MKLPYADWLRLPLALLLTTFVLACSDSSDRTNPVEPPDPEPPEPELTYQTDIVWTKYGIPHVTADDWGSLGYGSGYVLAKENYCTLMRAYVDAGGNSARYFGDDGDLDRDLLFKMLNDDAAIERMWKALPEYMRSNLTGYVAGVNRYLNETGVENLAEGPEGCRGGEWIREVTVQDAMRSLHMLVLYASSYELAPIAVAANPDSDEVALELPEGEKLEQMLYASMDREKMREALGLPSTEVLGSNAYGVGGDASQNSAGILFGNPHFPWQGGRRLFMSHLTMGDEYDFMGAALIGVPMPLIGFNQNLAWSHTVSTAQRFTFYELTLNPENKLQYLYDDEYRDFDTRTVSAERKTAEGSVETVEHTFYLSHYGPVVDLGVVNPLAGGWPNAFGTMVSYRDANLENTRLFDQFIRMGQANDMAEFKEALRPMGLPWVNTVAADRYGDAFYADVSVTPHASINKIDNCVRTLAQNFLTDEGILTMDGSDSACEWGSDPDTAEGILGYDSMPKMENRQYVANANDSYWLSNPRSLITGYPKVIGEEGIEQSIRTRHTFDQADRRLAGQDEYGEAGFNIDNIRELSYQATNHAAELVLDDIVDICNEVQDWAVYTDDPATAEKACAVLGTWDRRHQLESVGGHVFTELWKLIYDLEGLWSVDFNPALPVSTPHTVSLDSEIVETIRQSLADAAATLKKAGIPMDRPWGEVQYVERNGERLGIHGGYHGMMFSVIISSLVDGEGYSNVGYGNSYMQAVTWDETDCPDAYAILTYSQSTDPDSAHYADATKLYSEGGWIDMPFCERARDEQEIDRATISE